MHGTVNVVIHNCSDEVSALLHRFDIWGSTGTLEYNKDHQDERPHIWFECPIEFFDFVETGMGKECLKRMGIKEILVEY
jgi:hypothetical protein